MQLAVQIATKTGADEKAVRDSARLAKAGPGQ